MRRHKNLLIKTKLLIKNKMKMEKIGEIIQTSFYNRNKIKIVVDQFKNSK
jgi:hypothetical protein